MNTVQRVHVIDTLEDARLRDFVALTDVELRKVREPVEGLYLAESLKIMRRAIAAGHTPRSVLTSHEWLDDVMNVFAEHPDTPIFLGTTEQLAELTGFHLHRGAIASMMRPPLPSLDEVLRDARTVVVLEGVADHTNVGAVFRSVAALGADAVIVMNDCADPLYRRSVRVSMGAVLQVPWTRSADWGTVRQALTRHDVTMLGFALSDTALDLEFAVRTKTAPDRKVALLFGSEGRGLTRLAQHHADALVTIPMHHGVDSLNIATAAGIALWAVRTAVAAGP